MQKKLIALALASAFAAPAFAATSNVDIYGQINESVERVDNGLATYNRMVTNNNSFLGFKGSEDLGGGLKAVWQLETNVSFDGNGSSASTTSLGGASNMFGTRNTYVGLAGGFGTVIAGVSDTPYKMSTGPLDQFVGTLGDYNAIFGSAGASGSNSSLFDLRTANTIAYLSPNFSGFDFKAGYVMGLEGQVTTVGNSRSSAYSLSGTYTNGPLFATAAYEKHNSVGASGTCNTGAVCLTDGLYDRDAWKIGAGYTIGAFKVGALYEKMSGDGTLNVIDHKSWMLNGAYNIGAVTLKASYTKAGDLSNVAGDNGAKMYALGADYALSKRTVIQAVYAKIDNEAAGSWDLGQGPTVGNTGTTTATGLGASVSGFGLGVRHSF